MKRANLGAVGRGKRRNARSGWVSIPTVLLIWLGFFFAESPSVFAQQDIVFHHITVKDGLSQGGVNCILQDRLGFIWLGTQDGLNRYDGYEFVIYRHDPSDPKSIDDNFIIALAEDSSGTLWVRTRNSPTMLNRFDRGTGSFELLPKDSLQLSGATINSVKPGFTEPSGVRWMGDIGDGVARFDPVTGSKKVFRHDPHNPKSLIDDKVYSIYGDHLGTIWVGTKEGLDRFDRTTESFAHFRHDDSNPRSLSDNWVWPILEDRSGTLWVGTYNGGLNKLDRSTGSFTRYVHDEADQRSLGGNQLYSLIQDQSGLIWVGMNDHGVDTFQPELGGFSNVTHDPSNPASLLDNNILCLYADRAGTVWVATRGGLDRYSKPAGPPTHFRHDPADARSLGDNLVQSMVEDRGGSLWLGMVSAGLDRYNANTATFTHFRSDPADPNSLSDNRIYALVEDHEGMLWIGTYGGGLDRYDPSTGKFSRYVHADSIPGSLGARGVFSLLVDHEGTLWVGTFGGGLDRFDKNRGTFTHFRNNPADPSSLSDDLVASLYEDHTGVLWVGTTGGLNQFDRSTGTCKVYRVKDGLPNEVIYGMLEDAAGNLWMSTNKGIARLDAARKSFSDYDYADGLQGDEFNQNAYARNPRTGEMYFGGSNGFTMFQPANIKDNPYVPPLAFVKFTRYNTDDKEGKPIAEKGIDTKKQITLTYKDNVASFEFSALSYFNSSRNQYAYKLEGFSNQWIQLGTERKATFTNLSGGEYRLRIRGSNNDGVWNDAGASLRLIVTPPWWKTTWAYTGYLVLVVGLLYSLRRFELNRREQKALVRESELRAKAAEAETRALEAENERKTKELEDARHLQLSMLPGSVPQLPAYDIAVFMKTATEVGGDYYDFSVKEDGTLNIAFGDATGHGMQAGTIVTLMKGLFLSDAARFDITTFFNHCSRAIKEIRLGRLFMAFSLVRLNGKSVYLSSAGMPPVYVFRKKDGSIEEISLKGMPLGAMKNFPYVLHETSMEPGDTLLLLTDGLPEQKNLAGEMFDYGRVHTAFADVAMRSPQEIIDHCVTSVETWMKGAVMEDDMTLLVVRFKEMA